MRKKAQRTIKFLFSVLNVCGKIQEKIFLEMCLTAIKSNATSGLKNYVHVHKRACNIYIKIYDAHEMHLYIMITT